MNTRRPLQTLFAFALLLLLALTPLAPSQPAQAQSTSRVFPETGKTVRGTFLSYWNAHGGLPQQGFPITNELVERSDIDGKSYSVQYFERAVFELHPELAGTPHEVLLSLLGVWQHETLYGPTGAPNQKPNTSPGSVLFRETGKRVGGAFLRHWQRNGGLAQQGYPITDEIREVSAIDGKPYTVQYFERAVFEMHPEMAGTPYEMMLSQLGRYRHEVKYGSPGLPAAEGARAQVNLAASDLFLVWREVKTGDDNPDPEYRPTYLIRALDLRTGRASTVATTKNEFSKPAISGSLVAWASENPQCPECDLDVYAHDLATGETTLVATGPAIQFAPAVGGRTVAWKDHANEQSSNIVVKRLGTQLPAMTISRIPDLIGNIRELAVGNRYIVWTQAVEGFLDSAYSLIAYDLQTGHTSRLLANEYSPGSPSIAMFGTAVVVGPPGKIIFVDIATANRQEIPSRLRNMLPQAPALVASTAVWLEGDQSRTGKTLMAFSFGGSRSEPVVVDTGPVRDPAISGDRLFYIKDGKLASKRLSELFGGANR